MGLILEIANGPLIGKQLQVASTESLTVGRGEGRSQFVVAHDSFMSGLHFTIGFTSKGCCLRDLHSANGTYLNGERIQEAVVANGDEIRAGKTSFRVRMVSDTILRPSSNPGIGEAARSPLPQLPLEPPAVPEPPAPPVDNVKPERRPLRQNAVPPPPAPVYERRDRPAPAIDKPVHGLSSEGDGLHCGPWRFDFVPLGWEADPEFGFQLGRESEFPTSISASEENLGAGIGLAQFVQGQIKSLKDYLKNSTIEAAASQMIKGATETISFEVRYTTRDGQTVFLQKIYAKCGNTVGVLSLTTLDKDRPKVQPVFQNLVGSVQLMARPVSAS